MNGQEPITDERQAQSDEGKAGESQITTLGLGVQATGEEQRKQDHSRKVEDGRWKKANETIKSQEAEIARLREEIEKNEANGGGNMSAAAVAKLCELVGDDTAGAVIAAIRHETRQHIAPIREDIERFETGQATLAQREDARLAREVDKRTEERFPGMLALINDGGDNQRAWKAFTDKRPGIHTAFRNAVRTGDDTELFEYLERFYQELNVVPPERNPNAHSSPRMSGAFDGSGRRQAAKTYTVSEVTELLEKSRKALDNGEVTMEQFRALRAEINAAYKEGRVTP